jgi:hypothetical protein
MVDPKSPSKIKKDRLIAITRVAKTFSKFWVMNGLQNSGKRRFLATLCGKYEREGVPTNLH